MESVSWWEIVVIPGEAVAFYGYQAVMAIIVIFKNGGRNGSSLTLTSHA
jgi:hypothetical protein